MANSTYLTRHIEPFIVRWVGAKIGVPLKKRILPVGMTTGGERKFFEFDGATEDGRMGLLVSTCSTVKPGGHRKLFVDAAILLNADLDRRIMAFVEEHVMQNFISKADGYLPLHRIEMMVCRELPDAMAQELAAFRAMARSEVGDKGLLRHPAVQAGSSHCDGADEQSRMPVEDRGLSNSR